MKVCPKCGSQVLDNAKFCPGCGYQFGRNPGPNNQTPQSINNIYVQAPTPNVNRQAPNYGGNYDINALGILAGKMDTSATIWMILGILQIIIGVCTLCIVYGIAPLGLGIWNVINSNTMRNNITVFRQDPSRIYPHFQSQKAVTIVFLVINLFFGGILGVIGSIYDLTIHSYVEQNFM